MEFEKAPFGVVGLETSFSLSYTHLVKTGLLSKMELIEKMSTKAAEVINIDKGDLSVGKVADIAIIDPEASYEITKETFVGKSKNSPFIGMRVEGEVTHTLAAGKVIYQK